MNPHMLLLYHTVTPLHVGCGQDVGVVDLPIIRERSTGWPFVPGSSARGTFRSRAAESLCQDEVDELFGPPVESQQNEQSGEENTHAGCVSVYDARVLLFPVRSDICPFLWITCPSVLRDFDFRLDVFSCRSGLPHAAIGDIADEAVVGMFEGESQIQLEEYGHTPQPDETSTLKLWSQKLEEQMGLPLGSRVAVVSDKSFFHFITFATMVVQRNKLTSVKTVAQGALFSVEALPPETILYGFVGCCGSRKPGSELSADQALAKFKSTMAPSAPTSDEPSNGKGRATFALQLGGQESVGWGLTRVILAGQVHE